MEPRHEVQLHPPPRCGRTTHIGRQLPHDGSRLCRQAPSGGRHRLKIRIWRGSRKVNPQSSVHRERDKCSTQKHATWRSEEHTSELQTLMRISYAVFCLKKKKTTITNQHDKTKQNHKLHMTKS